MLSTFSAIFKRGSFPLFVIVGAINTLFGYLVFAIGIYCGLHYTLASLLSLCLGITFNFHTIGKVVFNRFEKKLIVKFVLMYFIQYAVSIFLLKINRYWISNFYINGFIVTLFMAFFSYSLNKYIVFRK